MLLYKLPLILTSKSLFLIWEIYVCVFIFRLAAWEIIRSWLTTEAQQTIKFVDAKSIEQFIECDQLPMKDCTVSEEKWFNDRFKDCIENYTMRNSWCSRYIFLFFMYIFSFILKKFTGSSRKWFAHCNRLAHRLIRKRKFMVQYFIEVTSLSAENLIIGKKCRRL
jgi:hypothetical protein